MTAGRSVREKKASAEAGPLALVKIDVDAEQQFVCKINCTACVAMAHRNWSAYRRGEDNGFIAAMDRWVFHLDEKHPGTGAPCPPTCHRAGAPARASPGPRGRLPRQDVTPELSRPARQVPA